MGGVRVIINISKKKTDIASILIGNKTIKNYCEIASEFNQHFTSIAKQIEENLIKTKHINILNIYRTKMQFIFLYLLLTATKFYQ